MSAISNAINNTRESRSKSPIDHMPNRHYRKLALTLALALIQMSKQALDWDAQEDECSHFVVRQEW